LKPGKNIACTVFVLSITLLDLAAQIEENSQSSYFQYYFHIAHTRTQSNPNMDQLAESLDYSVYDMLWLGGDLALSTSLNDTIMTHVDSIFDLGNENTLWALGNHDYADLDRVQTYTHRPPFYAFHKDKITFLVLDTQDSLSNIVGEQKELFDSVIDTIQESTHLILLHHKLIWMYGDAYLQARINSIPNGGFGDCFYCINPNNFYSDLYPKLLEIEEKGIEVICIAGDIGFRANEFEYTTPEGVQFLASGIEAGNSSNQALLLKHDLIGNILTWEFAFLTDLYVPESTYVPELNPVSIFPNPSSGVVYFSEDPGIISIRVYDLMGRPVKSVYAPESGFIDLTEEPKGLYLVCLLSEGNQIVRKKVLIQ
jgi:hypothetical protein